MRHHKQLLILWVWYSGKAQLGEILQINKDICPKMIHPKIMNKGSSLEQAFSKREFPNGQ